MFSVISVFVSLNCLAVLQHATCTSTEQITYTLPLLMPDVQPMEEDTYFCKAFKIESDEPIYLTAFEPNSTMQTAHHALISGCEVPGSLENFYNCNTMSNKKNGTKALPMCRRKNSSIRGEFLYLWARDAPKLDLPKDVGFKVGGDSRINYLVLQVHYADVTKFKDGLTDNSGIIVHYKKERQPKSAGVFQVVVDGRILPHSTEYFEAACTLPEKKLIHPFAFRAHTHELGKVVSGYKVNTKGKRSKWSLIGKVDPLLPQMFYPITKEMTMSKGDILAVRCTMKSERDTITRTGPSSKDEMCMYYIMYWTDGEPFKRTYCKSRGPPIYSWARSNILFNIPPDAEVSALPIGESAIEQGYVDAAY